MIINLKIKKGFFFILLVIIIFIGCKNNEQKEVLQNENIVFNNKYEQYLVQNNIPIKYVDQKYYISSNISVSDLIAFLELLKLEMDIVANNITNVNTTRTDKGGTFNRNIVTIDNGKINIIKDDSPARFVFDPTHPDSIKTGKYAGYVELPNIDIVSEMENLILICRIYGNILKEIELKNLYKEEIMEYFSE